MLKLFNTLNRKKENFKPIGKKWVGIYTCGPTVYSYAHIGNMRAYLFEDILKRVLKYNWYKVKHVMNITDVGHLTSDADTGEDKLEKGAKRENKTVWEIAKFYANHFKKDLKNLNIIEPDVWVKATDTIKEQIDLIKLLEKKGFTYKIGDGVYFNSAKLKKYGELWGAKKPIDFKAGARVKMVKGKKKSTDFALWKCSPKGLKRQMEWESPWCKGFPGWHTECVVMGIKELGIPFDVHCGGVDHIQIHHTNEIAQSQAAYNKNLANYWMHGDFLITKEKMAKSKGNIIIVDDLNKKGFCALSYRYLTLTAHYRSKLVFSWESLEAAQNALKKLYEITAQLQENDFIKQPSIKKVEGVGLLPRGYVKKFLGFINDDLDMPRAIALMWQMIDDKKLSNQEKYKLLLDFDKVFGLGLAQIKKQKIPKTILELAKEREHLRKEKQWQKADQIRKQIEAKGYHIEDTDSGTIIKKR